MTKNFNQSILDALELDKVPLPDSLMYSITTSPVIGSLEFWSKLEYTATSKAIIDLIRSAIPDSVISESKLRNSILFKFQKQSTAKTVHEALLILIVKQFPEIRLSKAIHSPQKSLAPMPWLSLMNIGKESCVHEEKNFFVNKPYMP